MKNIHIGTRLELQHRKRQIMASFTVEDLCNRVTESSIADAINNIDKQLQGAV